MVESLCSVFFKIDRSTKKLTTDRIHYSMLDVRCLQSASGGFNVDGFVKSLKTSLSVIPAKAGIQYFQMVLDACLRRHDGVSDFLRVCQCSLVSFFDLIGRSRPAATLKYDITVRSKHPSATTLIDIAIRCNQTESVYPCNYRPLNLNAILPNMNST
jgi:hypothetical protein